MTKLTLTLIPIFLLTSLACSAQIRDTLPAENDALKKQVQIISDNQNIHADSAYHILSNWNQYPVIQQTKKWYLFHYADPVFGKIPLKVYIPENYKKEVSSPAVLVLHGALVLSSFKDAYKDTASDEDLFYNFFAEKNFIIIRPYADGAGFNTSGKINFDWVVNKFNGRTSRNKANPTYQTLVAIINQLKQVVNIDDNKIFAFGHSDGADGAFALEYYQPSAFAGFVVYNSMLQTIHDYDIYISNTLNRPLYLVHSDLDDLRPIQQARLIMKIFDSLKSPVLYKEYIGYQHYDKHLPIDLPYSYEWMKGISRNPFQKNISWETSSSNASTCDWLRITQFDTTLASANWQTELNTKLYNKRDKIYMDELYYNLNKSGIARASYNNNTFELSTSRIKEVELLISPVMVNLQNPVIVRVNGKEVFHKKVTADKHFLLHQFATSFDRKTLWITSIKIKVN